MNRVVNGCNNPPTSRLSTNKGLFFILGVAGKGGEMLRTVTQEPRLLPSCVSFSFRAWDPLDRLPLGSRRGTGVVGRAASDQQIVAWVSCYPCPSPFLGVRGP